MVDEYNQSKRSGFNTGLPVQRFRASAVSARSEQDEMDQDWLRNRGTDIRGLMLLVAGRQGHGKEVLDTRGIASTISSR